MTPQALIDLARAQRMMIATAESCTGGLVAAALTDISGSSAVFDRGFVTYSNAAKTEMLGVPANLIATHGAVSAEVARAMAQGALAHSAADIAVSITGIAGPGGGSEEKPVGLVHFACSSKTGSIVLSRQVFSGNRDAIRRAARDHALQMLGKALAG